MFEKLGMVCKSWCEGNKLKMECYKNTLDKLKTALDDKKQKTDDKDRKDDLQILHDNITCLLNCVNILSTGDFSNDEKKCMNGKPYDVTYHGLHYWLRAKYEKLGWMCLARNHENTLKIKCYMDSIHNLKTSLETKLEKIHENDHEIDIKIMIKDVCLLQKMAHKLLGVQKSKSTSRKTRKTSSNSSHSRNRSSSHSSSSSH
jgi:hypothetical protein